MAVRVGVVGASGYTGVELLRLLAAHPDADVVVATADSHAGERAAEFHPALAAAYPDLVFAGLADVDLAALQLDLVFLGLPHQASMALAPELVGAVGCVVDLSAAFRLKDAAAYPRWYGFAHEQQELLAEAVYGLPERTRAQLPGARLVATPGCYVTAATLALAPLLDAGVISATGIIVDAASGVSGAGRTPTATNAFCAVSDDFVAYGLLDHRHTPEIEQNLGADVLFTPHLAPMSRGILATCYARSAGADPLSTGALLAVLEKAYADEPFVVATAGSPSTKATLGSYIDIVNDRYEVS
jgi:N-acetyl-gamma-glutamyl-phosphate reductase